MAGGIDDFEKHVKTLKELTESASTPWVAPNLRLTLGGFYRLSGKCHIARQLLLSDMKSGMDLLSDNDPENDYVGYEMIANISMHAGDDSDALSAWSLYGSPERLSKKDATEKEDQNEVKSSSKISSPEGNVNTEKEEKRNIYFFCHGKCNKLLTRTASGSAKCATTCYLKMSASRSSKPARPSALYTAARITSSFACLLEWTNFAR